ncbi:MAG: gamma-glutamyl-phosphate reductase, partial [Sphingopyxis sp.]|nr:gamma-glutamyl-phosphate reductase [Sphingopyxis sp.]
MNAEALTTPPMPGDAAALIADMGARARVAAKQLALAATADKAAGLIAAAAAIRASAADILAANAEDMAAGRTNGLSGAMLDRLRLDETRLAGIADAIDAVAALPDPSGDEIDRVTRPNGLVLSRVRVPLG